jgi:hypothetical protein
MNSSLVRAILIFAAVAVLAVIVYWPAIGLPFISDDYLQITLSRKYGPVEGWGELLRDPLYRARATSHPLTYWVEQVFGVDPVAFNVTSLVIHILNVWLVLAFGLWSRVGMPVAVLAAAMFAVRQRPQEAVIWYSAVPELLVFFFFLATIHLYIRFLKRPDRWWWYAASLVTYVLALGSKESAVMAGPVIALILWWDGRAKLRHYLGLIPFAVFAGIYTLATFSASKEHLHFNDGTFAMQLGFVPVALWSVTRTYWVWGIPALAFVYYHTGEKGRRMMILCLGWSLLTVLPYSFLTYMPQIPSRHAYLPTLGAVLLLAYAGMWLWEQHRHKLVIGLSAAFLLHQAVYIWYFKIPMFEQRARWTEDVIAQVERENLREVVLPKEWPFDETCAELAIEIRTGKQVKARRYQQ